LITTAGREKKKLRARIREAPDGKQKHEHDRRGANSKGRSKGTVPTCARRSCKSSHGALFRMGRGPRKIVPAYARGERKKGKIKNIPWELNAEIETSEDFTSAGERGACRKSRVKRKAGGFTIEERKKGGSSPQRRRQEGTRSSKKGYSATLPDS